MNDDDADETMRSAIREVMGHPLVGTFVMVATLYNEDGDARTAVHAPAGMTLPEQIGLLVSALNRANMLDKQGWDRAMNGGDD